MQTMESIGTAHARTKIVRFVVPDTLMPIDNADEDELNRTINPQRDSHHHGVDKYIEVLNFFENCLHNR